MSINSPYFCLSFLKADKAPIRNLFADKNLQYCPICVEREITLECPCFYWIY